MTHQTILLEITLSDWTPSNVNSTYNYVKIYEHNGNIIINQRKEQPRLKYTKVFPDKIICSYLFTPLELEHLKQNLDTVLQSTKSFTISFAPLGFEYVLEKSIKMFETFVEKHRTEIKNNCINKYKECIQTCFELQDKNDNLDKKYNKCKNELNEFIIEYNRLFNNTILTTKYLELLKINRELEDLFQKEKFEKEQFIAYCNNLNEKIVCLTID